MHVESTVTAAGGGAPAHVRKARDRRLHQVPARLPKRVKRGAENADDPRPRVAVTRTQHRRQRRHAAFQPPRPAPRRSLVHRIRRRHLLRHAGLEQRDEGAGGRVSDRVALCGQQRRELRHSRRQRLRTRARAAGTEASEALLHQPQEAAERVGGLPAFQLWQHRLQMMPPLHLA